MATETNPTDAGFRIENKRLQIKLPNCVKADLTAAGLQSPVGPDDALLLLRILGRYHQEVPREKSTAGIPQGDSEPVVRADESRLHWLECSLQLLQDYREHNLLRYERRVTSTERHGRINWRATLRRETACISNDGVVYLSAQRTGIQLQEDHPVTALHALTICELCAQFGAELGVLPPEACLYRFDHHSALRILKSERNQLYRDRDRRVSQLLSQYWLGHPLQRRESSLRRDLLWTDHFDRIWERMTRQVVGSHNLVTSRRLPTGRYTEAGENAGGGLDLKPDFIVDVVDTRIVFDAKYYTSGSLPPSGDVLKQLAYAYFVSNVWHPESPSRTINVFLLPADSPASPFILTGHHRLRGISKSQRRLALTGDIWLFRVDYRAIARAYLSRSTWNAKSFLDQIDRWEES